MTIPLAEVEPLSIDSSELLECANSAIESGDFVGLADVAEIMMIECMTRSELIDSLFSVSKKLLESQAHIGLAVMAARMVVKRETPGSVRQTEAMGKIVQHVNHLSQFSEQRDALLQVADAAGRNSPLHEECMDRLHELLVRKAEKTV